MRIPDVKFIAPAVLAFLLGLIAWQIQRERLALEYEVVQSAPFPRGAGTGKYFIIRIQNSGNKQIEHIGFEITFEGDAIESARFAEVGLVAGVSERPSVLTGTIPLLNPDEVVSVTITTFSQVETRAPVVVARAPGVTGRPKSESTTLRSVLAVAAGALGVAGVAMLIAFLSAYETNSVSDSISKIENLGEVSKRIEKSEEDFAARMERIKKDSERELKALFDRERRDEEGEPEQPQVLFALMNRAGLGHKFIDLATGDNGIKYWRTGLFLLRAFLTDEQNSDRYVSAMESLVGLDGVAPSTKGFNFYLLAKIEQHRGNSQAAIKWLGRCREETPRMYEHLMAQDPAFDLAAIREYFGQRQA